MCTLRQLSLNNWTQLHNQFTKTKLTTPDTQISKSTDNTFMQNRKQKPSVPFAEWICVGRAPGDRHEVLGLLDEHHEHPARLPARVGGGRRRCCGRRGRPGLGRRHELERDDDLAAVAAVGAGGERGQRRGQGEWEGGRHLGSGGGRVVDEHVGLQVIGQ